MTGTEFGQLIATLEREATALSERKRKDYATTDVLSNFKRVASILSVLLRLEIRPEDMAMVHLVHKLDRIYNLRGREPGNEAVRDSILDAINYLRLFTALIFEKENDDVV